MDLLGTFLCSASANTFNQVFEVRNDGCMARTMRRPLPSGRCSRRHAAAFGVAAGLAGVLLLREKTNDLTARLGACNIGLYALCYTPLKQVHWLNTWVGAVVGAVPPLMGWAAARDALEPQAMVLAAALYFWQMPHFMALAWMARDDYVRGGYRMMSHPAYDVTGRRVAAVALRNAAYMLPIGVAAVACGLTTPPSRTRRRCWRCPWRLARRRSTANHPWRRRGRCFTGRSRIFPRFRRWRVGAASRASRARRSRWKCACPRARGCGASGAWGGGRVGGTSGAKRRGRRRWDRPWTP